MYPSSIAGGPERSSAARKSILFVEDEFLIRLMASDELRHAGYDVIEANNADEALAVLNSSARVDMIVSDVRMPGSMDGLGLLQFVKHTFPDTPVVITSGHLQPTLATGDGANRFIPKPYLLGVLVEAVKAEFEKVL